MIKIIPAILERDIDNFIKQVKLFTNFGDIDIDIAENSFAGNETIGLSEIIDRDIKINNKSIGFHLMVNNPKNQVQMLLNSKYKEKSVNIFIHQESNGIEGIISSLPSNWGLHICVKNESELKDLDFYEMYDGIQIMTVSIGNQGGMFDKDSLKKVDRLRALGYNKKITIDGGVNLETSNLIKQHKVNRVSVGSYFKNAKNISNAFKELDFALNGESK